MTDPKIVSIPNRKPADELADIREKIRTLKAREEILRNGFLGGRYDPEGDEYTAFVKVARHERIDTPKLKKELGMQFLRPFLKVVKFEQLRLKKRGSDEVLDD